MTSTVSVQGGLRSGGVGWAALLREAAIVVVACGVAGIVAGGIGARFVMRISALAAPEVQGSLTENGNVVGDITIGGTIGLALFATVGSALLGAGALVIVRPWLPERVLVRGVLFGAFLMALAGGQVVDPSNSDFVILGDRLLNVAMFSALFLVFGLVASAVLAFLERRVPAIEPSSPLRLGSVALLSLPILPGLFGVTVGIAPELGFSLVGARLGMLLAGVLDRRHLPLATVTRFVATAVLVVVVLLAGIDYVRGVVTIL